MCEQRQVCVFKIVNFVHCETSNVFVHCGFDVALIPFVFLLAFCCTPDYDIGIASLQVGMSTMDLNACAIIEGEKGVSRSCVVVLDGIKKK